jgi:hypothetical protein
VLSVFQTALSDGHTLISHATKESWQAVDAAAVSGRAAPAPLGWHLRATSRAHVRVWPSIAVARFGEGPKNTSC